MTITDEKYGEAIRVMHHGCEEAIRLSMAENALPLTTFGLHHVAIGYAFALQIMTRRPAQEHLRNAVERILGAETRKDPTVQAFADAVGRDILGEWFEDWASAVPEAPHEVYERERSAR